MNCYRLLLMWGWTIGGVVMACAGQYSWPVVISSAAAYVLFRHYYPSK